MASWNNTKHERIAKRLIRRSKLRQKPLAGRLFGARGPSYEASHEIFTPSPEIGHVDTESLTDKVANNLSAWTSLVGDTGVGKIMQRFDATFGADVVSLRQLGRDLEQAELDQEKLHAVARVQYDAIHEDYQAGRLTAEEAVAKQRAVQDPPPVKDLFEFFTFKHDLLRTHTMLPDDLELARELARIHAYQKDKTKSLLVGRRKRGDDGPEFNLPPKAIQQQIDSSMDLQWATSAVQRENQHPRFTYQDQEAQLTDDLDHPYFPYNDQRMLGRVAALSSVRDAVEKQAQWLAEGGYDLGKARFFAAIDVATNTSLGTLQELQGQMEGDVQQIVRRNLASRVAQVDAYLRSAQSVVNLDHPKFRRTKLWLETLRGGLDAAFDFDTLTVGYNADARLNLEDKTGACVFGPAGLHRVAALQYEADAHVHLLSLQGHRTKEGPKEKYSNGTYPVPRLVDVVGKAILLEVDDVASGEGALLVDGVLVDDVELPFLQVFGYYGVPWQQLFFDGIVATAQERGLERILVNTSHSDYSASHQSLYDFCAHVADRIGADYRMTKRKNDWVHRTVVADGKEKTIALPCERRRFSYRPADPLHSETYTKQMKERRQDGSVAEAEKEKTVHFTHRVAKRACKTPYGLGDERYVHSFYNWHESQGEKEAFWSKPEGYIQAFEICVNSNLSL